MSVQFEWQAGRDDGQWETIAKSERESRRRWLRRVPWWAWGVLVVAFVALSTIGYVAVQRRYRQVRSQIEFQIQGVIDLEARAFAGRDVALYLAQQDLASPEWYAQQRRRIRPDCSPSSGEEGAARDPCAPVLPAEVENFDLRGDVAWVQVVEGENPVRRVRFYRRTDLGWKHTAPDVEFWKTTIRVRYSNVVIQYHKRDQPYVEPLEERIAGAASDLCATLYCPSISTLEVEFSTEPPVYRSPYWVAEPAPQGKDKLFLSSPWLYGIPVEGTWDEAYTDELAYWVTYVMAARAMRSTTRRDLNPLQRAILDEYAAWYSRQDTAQAPILGRIMERQSAKTLPDVLRSVREARTLSSLLERWLSLSPPGGRAGRVGATAYFETLLNIEREALRAGRKDTFLLLQGNVWQDLQEGYYDQAQLDAASIPRSPVQVQAVEIVGDRARVRLREPLVALSGYPSQGLGDFVFFRLQSGDWVHASWVEAVLWNSSSSPTPTPTPGSP